MWFPRTKVKQINKIQSVFATTKNLLFSIHKQLGVVAKSWKYVWLANLISPATDRCDSSIWTLHTHIQPCLSLLVNWVGTFSKMTVSRLPWELHIYTRTNSMLESNIDLSIKGKAGLRLDYLHHITTVRVAHGISNGVLLTHAAGKVRDESWDKQEKHTLMSLAYRLVFHPACSEHKVRNGQFNQRVDDYSIRNWYIIETSYREIPYLFVFVLSRTRFYLQHLIAVSHINVSESTIVFVLYKKIEHINYEYFF